MNPHRLSVFNRTVILVGASLCLTSVAPATIVMYAEYHLGEAGSLGTNNTPQDSSGNNRNFASDISGSTATVGTSGVFAPGSTAYLDTSDTAKNDGWSSTNLFSDLPTDNFAFGIYVRAASNTSATQGYIFSTGNVTNSFNLCLSSNGWAASAQSQAWISPSGGVSGSFASDTWVHLALIRSSGTTTFYINGVANGTYTGAPINGTPLLSVTAGNTQFFDGQMDEARVVTFGSGDSTTSILNALQAVPEPGAWVSLLGGCGVLLGLRRRRTFSV
jgi:hypothetical protein